MKDFKRVILGAEYDDELFNTLFNVISQLEGKVIKKERGIAGSQEIVQYECQLDGRILNIESETYIGLSISGSEELVDKIVKLVS